MQRCTVVLYVCRENQSVTARLVFFPSLPRQLSEITHNGRCETARMKRSTGVVRSTIVSVSAWTHRRCAYKYQVRICLIETLHLAIQSILALCDQRQNAKGGRKSQLSASDMSMAWQQRVSMLQKFKCPASIYSWHPCWTPSLEYQALASLLLEVSTGVKLLSEDVERALLCLTDWRHKHSLDGVSFFGAYSKNLQRCYFLLFFGRESGYCTRSASRAQR
jgi:hypothetical protein